MRQHLNKLEIHRLTHKRALPWLRSKEIRKGPVSISQHRSGQGILGFRFRVGGVFLTNGYMGGCSKMFAAVKRWFNIQITNDSRYTLGERKIHNLF